MENIEPPKTAYSGNRFLTYTHIIATFEDIDADQETFMSEAYHEKDATPQEIEQTICERAVEVLICSKPHLVNKLVKISTCLGDIRCYEPEEQKKLKLYGSVSLGKFYFQPDQLCSVTKTIREHYPEVARDVLSNFEWQQLHDNF